MLCLSSYISNGLLDQTSICLNGLLKRGFLRHKFLTLLPQIPTLEYFIFSYFDPFLFEFYVIYCQCITFLKEYLLVNVFKYIGL